MRPFLLSAAIALAMAITATQAQAHSRLEKTVPPAGGIVASSPNEIRLTFSERIEPKLSGIVLTDAGGKRVGIGKPAADPNDTAELIVPLPQPLAPGTYKVAWHAVSVDTHKTEDSFSFTVKP